jgi:putative aldouronate transport system substrate-binding protein
MKEKNFVCVFMIVAMALMPTIVFAGGGDQKGRTAAEPPGGNGITPMGYAVPVIQGGELTDQFTIFKGSINMSPEETTQQRVIREKLGITYLVRGIQSNDLQTSINLMLASGEELADMLVLGRNPVIRNALIESGKVMEVSSLYRSPTLKTIPNIPEKVKQFVTEPDGKMYVLPSIYDINPDDPFPGWTLSAVWFRTDLMEQAGVTEQDLSTLAGFEGALRKFKALKDPTGNSMIPLSFKQGGQGDYPHQEDIIVAMFGVDMASGVSGMPAVMEIDGKRVFSFENPGYLEAFKWINRMYNEGLIDVEVTTLSNERFQEKLESGMIAGMVGHMAQGFWQAWDNLAKPEDSPPKWYIYPFQSPQVPDKTKQAISFVNPYPSMDIFIKKDTMRLNAAVNYIEWAQEPVYYRMHEVENGPLGTTWNFVDEAKRIWRFEPEYNADRMSGDQVRFSRVYNPVNVFSRNKTWYPWYNRQTDTRAFHSVFTQHIASNIKNHRVISNMDLVQAPTDGVIMANLPTLNQVRDEYTAKMIMAKTQTDCETMYREFLRMLETRAKWSAMKAEWEKLYATIK